MKYALDEKNLRIVGDYLGTAPYLQSIELIYSMPRDEGEVLHMTHLYHKDKIDNKLIKLFTYITDVDAECGPFTVLSLSAAKKTPWYIEIDHYIDDEVLSRYIDLSEAVSFIGPVGSGMMADTENLFHCGIRCQKPRLTFVVHYNSGFSLFPRNAQHERWRNSSTDYSLSIFQAMALGEY
jgi:hypothetical protein